MGERPDTTATSVPAPKVPERVGAEGLEAKWGKTWEEEGVYAFDRTAVREQVYSIDTPPPTVSGSLHVGHVFSYTHTDVVARFQRMTGKAVFYPMGWDDNGLPTERRVQNYYGVRVDPTLPYVEDFVPPHEGDERLRGGQDSHDAAGSFARGVVGRVVDGAGEAPDAQSRERIHAGHATGREPAAPPSSPSPVDDGRGGLGLWIEHRDADAGPLPYHGS